MDRYGWSSLCVFGTVHIRPPRPSERRWTRSLGGTTISSCWDAIAFLPGAGSRVDQSARRLFAGTPPELAGSYRRLCSLAPLSQLGVFADGSTRKRIHMPARACPGTPLMIR